MGCSVNRSRKTACLSVRYGISIVKGPVKNADLGLNLRCKRDFLEEMGRVAAGLALTRSTLEQIDGQQSAGAPCEPAAPYPGAMIDTMTQYRPWTDDGRRCIHCHWVDVVFAVTGRRSLGCNCPKCLYGQAGEGKSCCSWEREPGSDDELSPPSG